MTTGSELVAELGAPGSGPQRALLLAAVDRLLDVLRARAVIPTASLLWRHQLLRRTLALGRLGRVAVVGRRGAGKSSLANALADRPLFDVGDVRDQTRAPTIATLSLGDRRIEWIDTPGLRAAGEIDRAARVAEHLAAAAPDVVLVLCQASEVDAGIDDDLQDVSAIVRAIERATGRAPALYGVVTKVDELAPPDVTEAPFDDEKRANLRRAVTVLRQHMIDDGLTPWRVVPVVTYVERDGDRITHDLRWNLPALGGCIAAATSPAVIHRPERLANDLDHLRDGLIDALIEAFAQRAFALGAGPWTPEQRHELTALETCLVVVLEGLFLAPKTEVTGVRPSASSRGVARLLELARGGIAGLRAWRITGALAANRVRVLGANVASTLKRR